MTLLAKILIFLNLVLSVLMLTWALALFTNRVDWSSNAAKGEQPAGAMVARKARVDAGQASLDLAAIREREALRGNDGKDKRPAHDGLPTWEARRVGIGDAGRQPAEAHQGRHEARGVGEPHPCSGRRTKGKTISTGAVESAALGGQAATASAKAVSSSSGRPR